MLTFLLKQVGQINMNYKTVSTLDNLQSDWVTKVLVGRKCTKMRTYQFLQKIIWEKMKCGKLQMTD